MVALHCFGSGVVRRSALVTACLLLSLSGCLGKEPAPEDTDGLGGAPGAGGNTAGSGGAAPGNGGTTPGGLPCVTYADDFGPKVLQPVCGNCHGVQRGLPDFGTPAAARASCSLIGDVVRRGIMPPDGSGYVLSPDQRTLVANWVALGCPETAAAAAGKCGGAMPGNGGTTSTGGAPATGNAPPVTGSVVIDRAEWDPGDESLRIEGTASDAQATLHAEFTGRTEPVANDGGRFREEFTGVLVRPPAVTITASSGATATAAVVAK